MARLSELLDADWLRLAELSNQSPRARHCLHAFLPRFAPVILVRMAQCLHRAGWVRLAKLPALMNFVLFGIEVPPRLPIGPGLVLMHTQGTVLGARSIGSNATIYHQVTLGAASLDFEYTLTLRPLVGDGVSIGAGAKILGGIMLGDSSSVGANAVVLSDVPPSHIAVGVPAKNMTPKINLQSGVGRTRGE